ncbi:hypothetical protein [Prevotella sp. HUN102]|uniref:hypothetical protein n=1 Tax=Prevotella sp. HUN102 TaxID=1392486 RepID=UPI00048B265D|nr:hypothetical protein [Prevotella sp. HUN102]
MILHIFNPEHDLALANNDRNFTAPHVARQLRSDLGYIPAFWANNGDAVWVDDAEAANTHLQRFKAFANDVVFVDKNNLAALQSKITEISPWGWDKALKFQLKALGIEDGLLLSDEQLHAIRTYSSRQFSVEILLQLQQSGIGENVIGKSRYVTDLDELQAVAADNEMSVIKAPWSSSGRGIRYIDRVMDRVHINWARNIISNQGGITIEPYYNKVTDFAMEFFSTSEGVSYAGLSLFQTVNGVYRGNLLTNEDEKREIIGRYIDLRLLDSIRRTLEKLLTEKLSCSYRGALGVDMMIVSNSNAANSEENAYLLHPMIEINLRRTMGHVALSLSRKGIDIHKTMHIAFDGTHYHLHIGR